VFQIYLADNDIGHKPRRKKKILKRSVSRSSSPASTRRAVKAGKVKKQEEKARKKAAEKEAKERRPNWHRNEPSLRPPERENGNFNFSLRILVVVLG